MPVVFVETHRAVIVDNVALTGAALLVAVAVVEAVDVVAPVPELVVVVVVVRPVVVVARDEVDDEVDVGAAPKLISTWIPTVSPAAASIVGESVAAVKGSVEPVASVTFVITWSKCSAAVVWMLP